MKTPEQQWSDHWSTFIIPTTNVLLSVWRVRIHIRNDKNWTFELLRCTLDWVYTRYNLDISHNGIINLRCNVIATTAWKVSKYGVISGPYFPAFGLNTGKYRPEITSYLETFHALYFYNIELLVKLDSSSTV